MEPKAGHSFIRRESLKEKEKGQEETDRPPEKIVKFDISKNEEYRFDTGGELPVFFGPQPRPEIKSNLRKSNLRSSLSEERKMSDAGKYPVVALRRQLLADSNYQSLQKLESLVEELFNKFDDIAAEIEEGNLQPQRTKNLNAYLIWCTEKIAEYRGRMQHLLNEVQTMVIGHLLTKFRAKERSIRQKLELLKFLVKQAQDSLELPDEDSCPSSIIKAKLQSNTSYQAMLGIESDIKTIQSKYEAIVSETQKVNVDNERIKVLNLELVTCVEELILIRRNLRHLNISDDPDGLLGEQRQKLGGKIQKLTEKIEDKIFELSGMIEVSAEVYHKLLEHVKVLCDDPNYQTIRQMETDVEKIQHKLNNIRSDVQEGQSNQQQITQLFKDVSGCGTRLSQFSQRLDNIEATGPYAETVEKKGKRVRHKIEHLKDKIIQMQQNLVLNGRL